jgi:hypothetical protein
MKMTSIELRDIIDGRTPPTHDEIIREIDLDILVIQKQQKIIDIKMIRKGKGHIDYPSLSVQERELSNKLGSLITERLYWLRTKTAALEEQAAEDAAYSGFELHPDGHTWFAVA